MFLCNTEQCCKVLTSSKQDWFSSSVAFAMETSAHRPRLQPGLHHHPVFWGIGLCGGEALSGGDLSLLDALITSMQHYIPLCRYFWACRVAHLCSHISAHTSPLTKIKEATAPIPATDNMTLFFSAGRSFFFFVCVKAFICFQHCSFSQCAPELILTTTALQSAVCVEPPEALLMHCSEHEQHH